MLVESIPVRSNYPKNVVPIPIAQIVTDRRSTYCMPAGVGGAKGANLLCRKIIYRTLKNKDNTFFLKKLDKFIFLSYYRALFFIFLGKG